MRQTLFYLEPWLFDGWFLGAWILVGLAYAVFQYTQGNAKEVLGFAPLWMIVAAVIHLVLPNLQTPGVNPVDPNGPLIPAGLGIQGYGLCMLVAMMSGLGLALWRCRQVGFSGDRIFTLAFWMIVCGLIGARAFYVIQKWDNFSGLPPRELFFEIINMTQGGLVVYGSLIGGMIAGFTYLTICNLSWRQVGDIVAPSMVLGLAIGRVGCLMNGCCYGGVCDADFPGLQFPPGSPPYTQQLRDGSLLGIKGKLIGSEDIWSHKALIEVVSVREGSKPEQLGIKPGDKVKIYPPETIRLRAFKERDLPARAETMIEMENGRKHSIVARELPNQSLKTHPTQLYSAVSAGLLCLVLWFYFPYRKSNGEVFALMLILYPITRFLLEMIRRDEQGQFGTTFTISQWVSMGIIVLGFGVWIYSRSMEVVQESAASLSKLDNTET